MDRMKEESAIDISVVIPVYNEEKNVTLLYNEIKDVLERPGSSYEVIFVNDGSSDGTLRELKEIKAGGGKLRVIDLARNCGQTAAIKAGFDAAAGEVIVTMDGDLQNDPRDIPALIEKLRSGYDLVNGWRKKRKDPYFFKVLPSRLGNAVIASTLGIYLHDLGCTFKAYRRAAAKDIELFGQMHRFIPALAARKGARITEMEVNHRPRLYGRTKYGPARAPKVICDLMLIAYVSKKGMDPALFFGSIAAATLAAAFAMLCAAVISGGAGSPGSAACVLYVFSALFFAAAALLYYMTFLERSAMRAYRVAGEKPIYNIRRTY